MIGVVFATAEEAAPFLKRYQHSRLGELEEGETTHDGDVLVTITGIGKIKATLRTERLLNQFQLDRLLHVGTCTALNEDLATGDLVAVTHVLEGDRIQLSVPSYPRMPLDVPFDNCTEGTLVTHDHGIADDEEYSYWQRIADISDTTGYAIAYVAAQHGTPCHIVKATTGHANQDAGDFRERLEAACQTIADFVLRELETGALAPSE